MDRRETACFPARARDNLKVMAKNDLLSAIDQAIAALQRARETLRATSAPAKTTPKKAPPTKRVLSEEARGRIAEAQRKRWAAHKQAAKKAARLAK